MMKRALTQMMTGKDNFSIDLFRILAAASVAVFLALAVVSVIWQEHKFDMQTFGFGLAAVLVAAASALKIKESTEPACNTTATETSSSTTSTEVKTS